jgi:hypothetical protein
MHNLARLLLCCLVFSAVNALPPKAEILADGLEAVNYWTASHDQYCGWEDATLMIGEPAGQQRQQQQHSQCLSHVQHAHSAQRLQFAATSALALPMTASRNA